MAVPASRIPVLIAILAFAARDAAAVPRPLDRARVHGLYQEGEFEKVVRELAAYGKGACACTRDDSVFAEKHLAVVLAANPVTRELGRYHMHRLLELSPRADLLDMYIGEEVDGVFEKVRKEHALRAAEPAAKPAPKPAVAVQAVAKPVPALPAPAPAVPTPNAEPASAPPKVYSDAWARVPAAYPPATRSAAAGPAGRSAALRAQAGRPAPIASASFRAKTPPVSAAAARPRIAAVPAKAQAVAAKAYSPWDQIAADTPAAPGFRASGGRLDQAASMPPPATGALASTGLSASAPNSTAAAAADTSRPAWKEPGLWLGGGAAIAAIAFTLWHAGSDDGEPAKTYAVPAGLDK
jgi:hypothetical protein